MKKNMKKLLVIIMAFMPSLSTFSFAQTPGGGNDSNDDNPIVIIHEGTTPRSGGCVDPGSGEPLDLKTVPTRPRIMSDGDEDGGPNDGGPIDLGLGTPRPRCGAEGEDESGEPIVIRVGTPRPRSVADTPECYHYQGVVYIEADTSITYINASVTRYADNQVWSNAACTNTLSITASPDSGVYLLELTLSNGLTYIGEYTIE